MARDSYGRHCRTGALAVSPPDEMDGPEIDPKDVAALVDSGEFCDKPELGMCDGEWVSSGADVFFESLSNRSTEVDGSAAAICRAMRGLSPRPGDLPLMESLFQLMRAEMLAACEKTLLAEAINQYED